PPGCTAGLKNNGLEIVFIDLFLTAAAENYYAL
ncbi:MAG: hypothetical protein QOF46_1315, partial [Paraburkholderia sp.]|nr:hypothetical protein [Paraburkholderia sp.]